MKVSDLMNTEPVVVYGGDTVQTAAEEMAKYKRGMVIVLNNVQDKKVVGVLSNKDIIEKVIAKKKPPVQFFVSDIMAKKVISITSDKNTTEAMGLMRKNNIKRIVVIDNGALKGVISSNDILESILKKKKELLDLAIDF